MNWYELKAVVLCGGMGNRMTELTDRIPKCLLPIAGIPMFWYPLNFLDRNNIKDVLLLANDEVLPKIKLLLTTNKLPPLSTDMNIELVSSGSATDEQGTADVLRHIERKIDRDFLVVSGDFVSDMKLTPMLAVHRSHDSALTCVLAENVVKGPVPGPKLKRSKGRDFVVLSEKNQLLYLGSEEDFDDEIPVNTHLFSKFRDVNMTARYNDCHVYVMKRWILDILKRESYISSIKAELIPYLLEKQYTDLDEDMAVHLEVDELEKMTKRFTRGTLESEQPPALRCFAYTTTPENGAIVAHVNTTGTYFEVNKAILHLLQSKFHASFPASMRVDKNAAMTDTECYVDKSVKLGDARGAGSDPAKLINKPMLKRSVIGADCQLGAGVKITNSLVMPSCVIAAGAQITNSILCTGAQIGESAEVTSSIIANGLKIDADDNLQNELVVPEAEMDIDQ